MIHPQHFRRPIPKPTWPDGHRNHGNIPDAPGKLPYKKSPQANFLPGCWWREAP